MKKIKLLKSIAALMPLSMALIPLTSCNKDPGETEHIVEPTEAEKTKNPKVGDYYATYSFLVKDGSKNEDITIQILNDTTNDGGVIECSSHNIVSNYLVLDIGFVTVPSDDTTATFDIKISNAPMGWSKTITGCKLSYKKPTASQIVVTTDATDLLYCSDKIQFTATVGGEEIAGATWTVSDETVASVDNEGLVTILKPSATFTVIANKTGFTEGVSSEISSVSVLDIDYTTNPQNITLKGFKSGYNKDQGEWINRCNGEFPNGKLIIPASVNTIQWRAFDYKTETQLPSCITSIDMSLATNLKEIGMYAFADNTTLSCEIVIPNSVTAIGQNAFSSTGITKITFPTGCNTIPLQCCDSCKSLTDVVIPEGYTTISENAFYYCTALENVTFPSTLVSIGKKSFSNNKKITSLTIPSSVTSIGKRAFESLYSLKTLDLSQFSDPSKLSLDESFSGAGSIELQSNIIIKDDSLYTQWQEKLDAGASISWNHWKIDICADSVIKYDDEAKTRVWGFNQDLEESKILEKTSDTLVIPKQVTTIISNAFCTLVGRKMPGDITKLRFQKGSACNIIEQYAFRVSNITDVVLPEALTDLRVLAFNSTNIEKISIATNSVYTSKDSDGNEVNGIFKINNGIADTLHVGTKNTNLSAMTNLKTIGAQSYDGRGNLGAVTIPSGVTKIGYRAFANSSLTSIVIPNTVQTVTEDTACFYTCTSLDVIDLSSFAAVPAWEKDLFGYIGSTASNKIIKVASGTKTNWETLFDTIGFTYSSQGWTIEEVQ